MAARTRDCYQRLIAAGKALPATPTVVARPCDESSLAGAVDAAARRPATQDPGRRIASEARHRPLRDRRCRAQPRRGRAGGGAGAEGRATMLMKGSLSTHEPLAAVVRRETGLRTARRLTHCFIMDVPDHSNVLIITDAAINIFPRLEDKVDVVQNAIDLARALKIENPKVAILSATEKVNPKLQSTVEAAAPCTMADRGQITGGVLDGPLALDDAISPEAAQIKGIEGSVAGRADILVVPDLEAGNVLAKSLSFLMDADPAGVVLGARVPIALTSRVDSVQTRLASCAVAALYAQRPGSGLKW